MHKHNWIYLKTDVEKLMFLNETYYKPIKNLRYCTECKCFEKFYSINDKWFKLDKDQSNIAINVYYSELKDYLTEEQITKAEEFKKNNVKESNEIRYLYSVKAYHDGYSWLIIVCGIDEQNALNSIRTVNYNGYDKNSFKFLGRADNKISNGIVVSEMLNSR